MYFEGRSWFLEKLCHPSFTTLYALSFSVRIFQIMLEKHFQTMTTIYQSYYFWNISSVISKNIPAISLWLNVQITSQMSLGETLSSALNGESRFHQNICNQMWIHHIMQMILFQIFKVLRFLYWSMSFCHICYWPTENPFKSNFVAQYVNLLNSIIGKNASLYSLLVLYIICVRGQSCCWNAPWFDFAT